MNPIPRYILDRFGEYHFVYNSCTADLIPVSDDRYSVQNLISRDLRKGDATRLMSAIVEFADDNECDLVLVARRYHYVNEGLDTLELIEFYSKFGFVSSKELPHEMERIARKKNMPYSEKEVNST